MSELECPHCHARLDECPQCHEPVDLTDAIAAPIVEAERRKAANRLELERTTIEARAKADATAQFEARLKASDQALADRDHQIEIAKQAELAARKAENEAAQAKRDIELVVQRRVDAEKDAIALRAKAEADQAAAPRLKALEQALAERDHQIEAAKQAEFAARKAENEAAQAKRDIELVVQRRLDAEKEAIALRARAEADQAAATRLKAVESALAMKDAKLQAAEEAELKARQLKAQAEEAIRQTSLTVERRLEEERAKIRELTARERDEEFRLKAAEKDRQLDALRAQIEEMRRTGSTGPQQLIGDVLEVDTLDILQNAFPHDRIERVRRGHRGCDVVHTVMSPSGLPCGSIAWETKRTKAFQEQWLAKLREDQREARADLAVLATETLPGSVTAFEEREGVWITSLATIVPLATVLRRALLEIATARRAGSLADSIKERAFTYLTTPPFRQRVMRVIEAYRELRTDLDREKRAVATSWSKREKQLDRMLGGLTGLYGDLQGIMGTSLPSVDGLQLPSPEAVAEAATAALPLAGSGGHA